MTGKFYWLKLKKDFFKRHDIRILESMPDGHIAVLFYLKLMLESVDHEGELRFSEKTAYSPEMLATITDTDIEVVKASLETLSDLGMIEIAKNGTIIIDKVKSMIGSASDSDGARRARRYRDKKGKENDVALRNVTGCVTNRNESIEIEKEIEIEIEKEIDKEIDKDIYIFVPPSVEEVYQYCQSRHNTIDAQLFVNYYQSKNWLVSNGCKMSDWKAAVRAWESNKRNYDLGD